MPKNYLTKLSDTFKLLIDKFMPKNPDEQEHHALLLILIGLVFTLSGVFFFFTHIVHYLRSDYPSYPWTDIMIDLGVAVFGILTIIVTRSGQIRFAKQMILGGFLFFATIQIYLSGNPTTNLGGALAMILFVAMAAVLLEDRSPWWAFLLAASIFCGMHILWLAGALPEPPLRSALSQAIFSVIDWLSISGLLTAGISRSMKVLRQQANTLHQHILDLGQAEEKIKRNLLEQGLLYEISSYALQTTNENALIAHVTEILHGKLYSDNLGVLLNKDDKQALNVHASYHGISEEGKKRAYHIWEGVVGQVAQSKQSIRIEDTQKSSIYIIGGEERMLSELCVPILADNRLIGVINAESRKHNFFNEEDERFLITVANQLGIGIERIRLLKKEMQLRVEAEIQHEISMALTQSAKLEDVLNNFLQSLSRTLDFDSASFFLLDGRELNMIVSQSISEEKSVKQLEFHEDDELFQEILRVKAPIVLENAEEDERFQKFHGMDPIRSWMGVPLIDQGQVFGIVTFDSRTPGKFDDEMARSTNNLVNQVSQTIIKAQLFESTNIRLQRLQALHTIHQIFSASVDLNLSLNQFLQIVVKQLEIDAAAVLFYNPKQHTLDYSNSLGFKTQALKHTNLKVGEGYAGQAVLERKIVRVDDLQADDIHFSRSKAFQNEGFRVYIAVPLIIKGQVIGVLELFHRTPISTDAEWEDFLMSLSTQAAIATENLKLLSEAQKTNLELKLAFDSTLEGLAQALDSRKQLPAGHSEHLAEMTIKLAEKLGVSSRRMIHIRRGVFLYDIGMIGIPDRLLEKQGELTIDEEQILKQNPVLAQQTLGSVPFLHPALDIPYCHHENWDGSGYPRGLREREIPLAARLFSAVNTYLTLKVERPYRKAWQEKEILNYLQEQSGNTFDPQVVEAFLELLKTEGDIN